ncbi:unnamed protein product [Spirodela intermedia]|uniref:Uncharacterized protein n=1 Tax=Spirodela intermedia TaxID=51605 RepID=A0A7I8K5V6_SPIIN|nr:unnamed protein product [Spirodela intermedia]
MRHTLKEDDSTGSLMTQREDSNYESDIDSEYNIFLDHLKEDGRSYVFEMSPNFVKYEEEDGFFSDDGGEIHGNIETCPRLRSYAVCKEKVAYGQSEREILKHLKLRKIAIDPCYEIFLRRVQVRGGSLLLKLANGTTVNYEEQIETPTTSITTEVTPIPAKDSEWQCKSSIFYYSFAAVFEDNEASGENRRCSKKSYFRKRLETISGKPFDQDEFEHLFNEVRISKPIEKDKQLRGATKTYQTTEMGKSYFDHHPDFAKKVKTACCDVHRFKLLHGFFFWLQNLCHDGSFRPWLDDCFNSCDYCQ